MPIKFIFISLFVINSSFIINPSLSEKQKKQVQIVTEAYTKALEQYSNYEGIASQDLRTKLLDLYDDPNNIHVNDLIFLSNSDDLISENVSWLDYLRNIDEQFHFGITIDFNINYTDCIDEKVAIVSIDKRITDKKGRANTKSEIIEVTLPSDEDNSSGYKIHEVLAADNYKAESNSCSNEIHLSNDDIELYDKKKAADNYYFELKQYLNAKNLYDYILNKNRNDVYARRQSELCKEILNKTDYQKKADGFFEGREFIKALYWYERLQKEYPDQITNNLIKEKIEQSKIGIIDAEYSKFINKADAAFVEHDFINARYNYNQALKSKPRDNYAAQRLEESKINDDEFARREINRISALATNQKYWGDYFRILSKYEGSIYYKRLNTQHYINMVKLLATYNKHVKREMNFTRKDFNSYLKIYSKKLNDALTWATNPDWIEQGNRLLKSVIKPRNQN